MLDKLHWRASLLVLLIGVDGLTHWLAPTPWREARTLRDINNGALQGYTGLSIHHRIQPATGCREFRVHRRGFELQRAPTARTRRQATRFVRIVPNVSAQAPILITSTASRASREASAWDSVRLQEAAKLDVVIAHHGAKELVDACPTSTSEF